MSDTRTGNILDLSTTPWSTCKSLLNLLLAHANAAVTSPKTEVENAHVDPRYRL
jgi:hypothetical protein